ncbi:MAG: helix-turn-helix transcriptional regulator [Acidimicrobiales bacterium]
MESSSGRLLAVLSLLQSRPYWTASELAERLSVTTRTVRRDVTRLRELGYPVEAAPGPTGGYQLGSGGALPPLLLNDEEALVIAIGLRAAASGAVAGFEDSAIAALAKLEQILPRRLRDRVSALNAAMVLVTPDRGGARVDPDMLVTLAQGCRRLERVRFQYRDAEGNASDRRVEPYRLVNTRRRWYFVALDLDRQAWRTFRVDRLTGPTLTGHRFTRSTEPDAAAMVAEGLAVAAYEIQAEVLLRVELSVAADAIPSTVGTLEPVEGGTLLRLGADTVDWIARFLARLEFPFEVRGPPELRAALRALGRRLLREHG